MNTGGKCARRNTWTLRLTNRLFRKSDEAAARHGWEIKVQPGFHGRVYRDQRFDQFAGSAGRTGADAEGPGRDAGQRR